MTHAANEYDATKTVTFGAPNQAPPKEPRLNDTEVAQLSVALRLSGPQTVTLIRFIERLD